MRLETTRKSDLAIEALLILASANDPSKTQELAEALGASRSFMAHVMSPLTAEGWVLSIPGPSGGYQLQTSLDDISVLDVIEAIEGPTDIGACPLRNRCNPEAQCALHDAWSTARDSLISRLSTTHLANVATARGVVHQSQTETDKR